MSNFICYMENQFTATGKEFFYFDFENKVIRGLHSPAKATLFKTKKEATKAIDEHYADKIGKNNVVISSEPKALQKEFNDWLENGAVFRELPMKSDASRPYNGEDGLTVLKWWAEYYKDESCVSYEDYKTWPRPHRFYSCIKDVARFVNRDSSYMAPTVSMWVNPDCDFETFKNELEIAKEVIEFKNESGRYLVDIFENSLSEFGSYHFEYDDTEYVITFRGNDYQNFDTLEELFECWRKRLPYSQSSD